MEYKIFYLSLFVVLLSCTDAKTVDYGSSNASYDTLKNIPLVCQKKNPAYLLRDKETGVKTLRITFDDRVVNVFSIQPEDYNGFAINWIKPNSDGFEISIEYGSINYVEKTFYFTCEDGNYYLSRVQTYSFNKKETENEIRLDSLINPKKQIERFVLKEFMDN